jgi:hypothetical protein
MFTTTNKHRRSTWLGFGPIATFLALFAALVLLTACGGTTAELEKVAGTSIEAKPTVEPAPVPTEFDAPEPVVEETPEPEPEPEPEPTPEPEPEPEFTLSQEQAIRSANEYLSFMAFSKSGLADQLVFEGFSKADAEFAVEHIDVSWKEQALESGRDYLDMMSFSRSGLIDQLEFEGFSTKQATYAVDQLGL